MNPKLLLTLLLMANVASIGCTSTKNRIGPFEAKYYDEKTNLLVATDTVERPALNYAWSDFYGIRAEHFYAIWEGDVELAKGTNYLDLNLSLSWAEASIYVNDELIQKLKSGIRMPLPLAPGKQTIRIEYRNNWHTVGFNTSFTSYPELDADNAKDVLSSIIDERTKILYVGAYGAGDLYNNVVVKLPKLDSSVFIFLSSNDPINWAFNNPFSSKIAGVAIITRNPSTTVKTTGDEFPVYKLKGVKQNYKSHRVIRKSIGKIVGYEPHYITGDYTLTSVIVPDF